MSRTAQASLPPVSRLCSIAARQVQRALWAPLLHLALVSVAGSLRPRRTPIALPRHSFRILIPARNEEANIAQSVTSALSLSYPEELRSVVVVADNCSDGTAAVARASGARVWERSDTSRVSKGAAIEWALERLLGEDGWDAVVVLDADSVLAPDFLAVAGSRLAEGAQVLQGERYVLNPHETYVSRLTQVPAAAQWVLRPRGRTRLGCPAKLLGNGMVFHRHVFEACPWRAEGLAEDVEYWIDLLKHKIRPVHEPGAVLWDLMPLGLRAAKVQRSRWDAGKAALLRREFIGTARHAVRERDALLMEALVSELVLPNLSSTGLIITAVGLVRWGAERRGAGVAGAQAGFILGHLILALRAAKASPAVYATLALAPGVAAWRAWVTLRSLMKSQKLGWQGTPRSRQ